MNWARMLAYVTGMVDQELLLRNEYLAAENRILKAQIKGRLLLSDDEKATLLSGYKLNKISWLGFSWRWSWESEAWSARKMGVFSKRVILRICRIW